jgi:hypothetical protein
LALFGSSSIAIKLPNHRTFTLSRSVSWAKFWLDPVKLVWSTGFASHELTELRRLVEENRKEFLERWNEYFNG